MDQLRFIAIFDWLIFMQKMSISDHDITHRLKMIRVKRLILITALSVRLEISINKKICELTK